MVTVKLFGIVLIFYVPQQVRLMVHTFNVFYTAGLNSLLVY